MASYGALIAISGFEYHGPQGHIGFAPRLTPENFRAPFTAAEGWGTYEQKSEIPNLKSQITMKYGKLRVKTLALALAKDMKPGSATVSLQDTGLECKLEVKDGRAVITFAADAVIRAGESLVVVVR